MRDLEGLCFLLNSVNFSNGGDISNKHGARAERHPLEGATKAFRRSPLSPPSTTLRLFNGGDKSKVGVCAERRPSASTY
jgi:hypothetical protein